MKKTLALLVALMLLLAAGAQAQTIDLAYDGVAFDIPEDFETVLADEGDSAEIFMFTSASLADATYIVCVGGDEAYPLEQLNAHSEDALTALFESIADDLSEPAYAMKELDGMTFMVITESTGHEVIYLAVNEKTFIELTVLSTGDAALTDAHIAALEAIAASVKVK